MILKLLNFVFLIALPGTFSKIIKIDDGKIKGTKMVSRLGRQFDAFLNIPFAEPPIRELRFQPPQPVKPWNGVRDGTEFGSYCYQQSYKSEASTRSEDCLNLNVFTLNLPSESNETSVKQPVIVFIHGGGWERGSGIFVGPNYIIDRNVVIVSINYRLGAFGFLSVGTSDALGNMALKDQTLALKWVHKNIDKFGGDPKRVTIAGFSAGSFSVTAHIVSPMSHGLFHRVIAMSGAITFQKKLETDQLMIAKELAQELECETEDISEMVKCLKSKPASKIAAMGFRYFNECPLIPWLPVIEPDLGQERFFTEQPDESLKKGRFSRVPIVIGMTNREFISHLPGVFKNQKLVDRFNNDFDTVAPLCASYEFGTRKSKEMSRKLKDLYFPLDKIDERSFDNLGNLISDGFISYAIHRFAHLASSFTDVFYYKFKYVGSFGVFRYPHDKPYDACHGDDVHYILGGESKPPDPEIFMVERMTRIFSQFAISGDPNNSTDEYLNEMNWPRLDTQNEFYMEIGEHFVEKHSLYLERFSVWDKCINDDETEALTEENPIFNS